MRHSLDRNAATWRPCIVHTATAEVYGSMPTIIADWMNGRESIRTSIILSLVLKAEGTRPLVIDQPQDKLDNRLLVETVLPTHQQMKGKRQVIVATDNANITVNGDGEMVGQSVASATHARIACTATIEASAVVDAIAQPGSCNQEAFRLRQRK